MRISDWSSDVCSSDLKGNGNLTFAGIRHRRQGDTTWSKGHFVLLNSYRDMSDVIVLKGLQADTIYEYQAGWLTPLSPTHTVETIQERPQIGRASCRERACQ